MATIGCKEIKTKWPVETGLVAETTKQVGRKTQLVPERGSFVSQTKKVGF